MKPIQLILIAVALVAALGAGFIMMNLSNQPAPVAQIAPQKETTVQVLVANEKISMGNRLTTERINWQEWPESGVREGFVTQETAPEAIEEYAATIARSTFYPGEPIREEKIVRSDSGYMSAILPSGKRAVAIRVAAETSAGGFILPNDHVDIVMSYTKEERGQEDTLITETILENVRVLAIDQIIEDEDGEKSHVGDTATMEFTPEQVEIIAASSKISGNKLVLALRSVEDSKVDESGAAKPSKKRKRSTVKLIRFGKSQEVETQN